jgi:hypothetical protein
MNAQIQVFDLEADYLAELDEASLNVVYGGCFSEIGDLSGIGDPVKEIYEAGKDFGHTVVDTFDSD